MLVMRSDQCKLEFENNYLDAQKKLNFRECEHIFPRELFEEKRNIIPELDIMINYMENKNLD